MKNNKWKCIKETTEKSFDFMNKSELQSSFEDILNKTIEELKGNDDKDSLDMAEAGEMWIDDYINDPEWGLVASTMRDMDKYVHKDDTSMSGNFADIRLDWEREHDDVSLNEVVEMIDNGEVNDITNEFRSWSIDWYFRAFGTYNLKYNWGEFISNEVAEMDYERERDSKVDESKKIKLDPYFSNDFDLNSLSYSDIEDLLNLVYEELNIVQDSRKERILNKNARKLENLLDDGGNAGEGFQFESSEEEMKMKWKKIVCESTSTLNIDYLIECAFEKDLNSDPANEVLRDNLNHYDFQDTDGDNQTECYFYFSKDIDEVTLEECKDRICDILGLQEYEFWESDSGDEDKIRIDAICHIEI